MHAIFCESDVCYVGNDACKAQAHWESCEGNIWVQVADLNDLAAKKEQIEDGLEVPGAKIYSVTQTAKDVLGEAVENFMSRLDELGITDEAAEQLIDNIRRGADRLVGSIRGLGCKGLNTLGALMSEWGEVLQNRNKE